MSAEIRTKSRRTLANMFGGEKVKLNSDFISINGGLESDEQREIKKEIQVLPAEIVLYLKSLATNLPELISDLISQTIEAVQEKEAARRLWERFGLPQSPLAVPVFVELSDDLGSAQGEVKEKSYNTQILIARVEQAIQKVLLFYAVELNRLEEEVVQSKKAVDQLDEIKFQGSTMNERTKDSIIVFTNKNAEFDKRRTELESGQNRWLEFVQNLKAKLPMLEYLERPIDLGAPDPAMAL